MTVCVDGLVERGWRLRGRPQANCHMFTDSADLTELHALAAAIGMRKSWFQNARSAPHYDLTPNRRADAVKLGAAEVDAREAVRIWRTRRAILRGDV